MSPETKILEYIAENAEFSLKRGGDCVCVNYFAYFDRSTEETEDFGLCFSIEDYVRGIEELLKNGSCSIRGPCGELKVDKIGEEEVRLYLKQDGCGHSYAVETNLAISPLRFLNSF